MLEWGVAWAGLWAITNASLGLIRSHDRLLAFGIVILLQSVVAEVLSVSLVVLVHPTASEDVLGHLVAQSAAAAVALIVARPLPFRRRDLPMLGGALGYSIGLVPAALASFVLDTSDRLIVRGDLGPSAVARYAVAYNIANLTILLLYLLNTAWMPRVFTLVDSRVRSSVSPPPRLSLRAPHSGGGGVVCRISDHPQHLGPLQHRSAGLSVIVAVVATTAFPYAGMMSAMRVLLLAKTTVAVGLSDGDRRFREHRPERPARAEARGSPARALRLCAAIRLLFGLLAIRARRIVRLAGRHQSRSSRRSSLR